MKFSHQYISLSDLLIDTERIKSHYLNYGYEVAFNIYPKYNTVTYEVRERQAFQKSDK